MLYLANGCYSSDLKVFPGNWKYPKASLKKKWYIHYRFYDPNQKTEFPKGKQVMLQGMNRFKTLQEKQDFTRDLLQKELLKLQVEAYNPITKTQVETIKVDTSIEGETPFLGALQYAYRNINCGNNMRGVLKSVLKYVGLAIQVLEYDELPIREIGRKHIKLLLQQCELIKETWSRNTFNVYRTHLSVLFNELIEVDAVDSNPVLLIKKLKVLRPTRKILTGEQCQIIDRHIKQKDERFWLFIHLFFHSGTRITEMLRLQPKDIDLVNQKAKFLILKGKEQRWVYRTIKTVAVPLWEKALCECKPDQYIFSVGLKPGTTIVRSEQVTRRWLRHVKKQLNIDCDFYSLKHLNTDQVSAELDLNAAAALNSHQSTRITSIYAVNEHQRVHERLKDLTNEFS